MRPIDLLRQRIQTPGSPMSAGPGAAPSRRGPPDASAGRSVGETTAASTTGEAITAEATTGEAITAEATTTEATTAEATTADPTASGLTAGATLGTTSTGGDDAILPASLDDNALRDAVGAAPARPRRKRRDHDGGDGIDKPGGRRAVAIIAALAVVVGLTVAGFVLLGRVNAQRFVIACTTDQVSAEQGRGFPPWGTRPLGGAEWKPITLPANAECKPRETDSRAELEAWFLDLLIDRASMTLTARDLLDSIQPGRTNPLDVVAGQLNQALLLSRAPERRDQRKEVERLLGDVAYWRASLRLRDAAAALADAARQFDSAAAQRPRHAIDAAQWAAFLRGMVDRLHGGPNAVPPVVDSSGEPLDERPAAPLGAALPVDADDAEVEPAPAPPAAGLPTGGVLL